MFLNHWSDFGASIYLWTKTRTQGMETEPWPIKARSKHSDGKLMAMFFFNRRGFYIDFLHRRRTIDAEYYCIFVRDVILLQDISYLHKKLELLGWPTLPIDQSFTPRLSCLWFAQISSGRSKVQWRCWDWSVCTLQTRQTSFYKDDISKLPNRWEKYVSKTEKYVKKSPTFVFFILIV